MQLSLLWAVSCVGPFDLYYTALLNLVVDCRHTFPTQVLQGRWWLRNSGDGGKGGKDSMKQVRSAAAL